MKNLLNCHSVGLHSFPISLEDGLYKRIFYADWSHNLWKPFELAVHPHQVDIKITVLDGVLNNILYRVDSAGKELGQYKYNSHILNGKGGFDYIGTSRLSELGTRSYKRGESTLMQACELHTVHVEKGRPCVWLVEESIPTCEYFPVSYSDRDLTKWTPEGLYVEVGDDIRDMLLSQYL